MAKPIAKRPPKAQADEAKVLAFVADAPYHAAPEVQGVQAVQGPPGVQSAGAKPRPRQRFIANMRPEVVERLKRVAWHDRRSVSGLIEQGVLELIDRLEAKRGAPYGPVGG